MQKKLFYSEIFGMKLQLRVTTAAMRCIDKAGGFDSYIYHTPDKKLASELGVAMKNRMHEMVRKDSRKSVPQLVKRYPRPPRSLVQPGVDSAAVTVTDVSARTYSTLVANCSKRTVIETPV